MSVRFFNSGRKQRGVATLAISLILLFLVTIVTLYTANTSVMEQKISANQYRSDQAFSAANAALDYAIATYDRDGDASLNTADTLSIEYANATRNASWSIGNTAPPLVSGRGISDDGTAFREMSVELGNIFGDGTGPEVPLISRGSVGISGNFTITNTFSDDSIWSGGPTEIGESASAETRLRDPADTNPDDGWDTKVSSSNKVGNGADIVDNDPNLSTLGPEEFFEMFVGTSKENFEILAGDVDQHYIGDGTQIYDENGNTVELAGKTGLIWIEGDAKFTGMQPDESIGTMESPAIVVVNGDADSGGNTNIIGLLYIIGKKVGNGSFDVTGAAVVEDDSAESVGGNGGLDIVFDPSVLGGNGSGTGSTGIIPGTWRDWCNEPVNDCRG